MNTIKRPAPWSFGTIRVFVKKFTDIVLVSIVSATSLFPAGANAGILNWVTGNIPEIGNITLAAGTEGSQSFDELFEDVADISDPEFQDNEIPLVQDSYILAAGSHITPNAGRTRAKRTVTVEMSAYSSTPDQTDSSPFITAKGTYVRDGIVAANFLPMGTRIKIPSLYGDKVFIVEDRMNKRYWQNVDIWMKDRQSAKNFGRRRIVIEIVS